ncbi:MAG: GNAT family N-acetyltransferase [Desulfobacteraceae bacterium]|jgi:acyl-CoA hydrolase/ribosomal protein S18 acetylase RimI-like enzyme
MAESLYWADGYVEKMRDAETAVRMIKPGQRVFIGSACGEPQVLVRALVDNARLFTGLDVVRMMSRESSPLSAVADKTEDLMTIRNIYLGSARSKHFAKHLRFVTPMNMSDVPALFKSRKLPIHVALIQVSPPDDFGWMSLGVSVDVTQAAAYSADLVIAQVNEQMPRVMGQSFIHVNEVDIIVEHMEDLLTISPGQQSGAATLIGKQISRLIPDGATLQVGLDSASQATVETLSQKNDLGFHSQYLTPGIMRLYAMGVINNRQKGFNDGKLVASAALGDKDLYEFLNDNPAIEFHPSNYVNNPFIISRHNRMISMNVAKAIDLTGQVAAEAVAQTLFAGVSGIMDFVSGARRSPGGKSILMLASTTPDGKKSNIVPQLVDDAVVVPRGSVHYVATEYGVVNLFGKSFQERAMAMISVAHPDFRDELFNAAKKAGLVGSERNLGEAARAVYPVALEETFEVDGESITIRPAKPVDERRIQEHYYSLDKNDVFLRFFHDKTSFSRSDVEGKSKIDYVKDLTLIAVVGESGFDRVVGVGEYLLLMDSNMAEVAFTVAKDYQGKGLGKKFILKLAAAAREHGISGLVAYTAPHNQSMINLFRKLPYKIKTSFDGEALALSCKFDYLNDEFA